MISPNAGAISARLERSVSLSNNMGLKILAALGGTALTVAYTRDLQRRLRKDIEKYKKKEPYALLDYMLSRVVVVCPKCGHIVQVETLEAQLSHVWRCFKCGCSWEETSHCDVIIDEGGKR